MTWTWRNGLILYSMWDVVNCKLEHKWKLNGVDFDKRFNSSSFKIILDQFHHPKHNKPIYKMLQIQWKDNVSLYVSEDDDYLWSFRETFLFYHY